MSKKIAPKLSDAELVVKYVDELSHPMKAEMEALRGILKSADPGLGERIKWNAPSYFFNQTDIVTFGPPARRSDEVMLVFHHPFVVEIGSNILTGDYKDRRLAHFKNMNEVEMAASEIIQIVKKIILKITE